MRSYCVPLELRTDCAIIFMEIKLINLYKELENEW